MNAVVASLLAAVFALAAYEAVLGSSHHDKHKIIYRFANRVFVLTPETRHFPENGSDFHLPKPYSPDRETVVFFHGSKLLDPFNIYSQELLMNMGHTHRSGINIVVVFWNSLIKDETNAAEIRATAMFVGDNTAELLKYLKTKYGGTKLRLIGFDFGAVAAESVAIALHNEFPVEDFTAINPVGGDYSNLRGRVDLIQVVYSSVQPDKVIQGDRTYFINDGQNPKGCPSSPENVSDNCKIMQSLINYFLSQYYQYHKYEVTYCPSWEDYESYKCRDNVRIPLYNEVPKRYLPEGTYYGAFETHYSPAFKP